MRRPLDTIHGVFRLNRLIIVALLALLGFFSMTGIALADRWKDISDAEWQTTYNVTAVQAATVAEGYYNGSFGPTNPVLRGQFAKMCVSGYSFETVVPETPTFSDVPADHFYYKWVEGGVAARIIAKGKTYDPSSGMTRVSGAYIVANYLSGREIATSGGIVGKKKVYPSLTEWYAAEGAEVLKYFQDNAKIADSYKPAVAYLVLHRVTQGFARSGKLYFDPAKVITRAQAVAFILRARNTQLQPVAGTAPQVTAMAPIRGLKAGGNAAVIMGSGFWRTKSVTFGGVPVASDGFRIDSQNQITVTKVPAGQSAGTVDVVVTTEIGVSTNSSKTKYTYADTLTRGDKIVQEAVKYVGVAYVWAGMSPTTGFDCSGFTSYVFGRSGISLPRTSNAQSWTGTAVPMGQQQPGDLVFFFSPVSHVAIYVGNASMIHSPGTGKYVTIEPLWQKSYHDPARRVW